MRQEESIQRNIGKYEVIGTLGRGSMGVVYKARDPEIGRVVAVKTLRRIQTAHFNDADAALQRFQNEARSAGNLRHPNIITIFEVSRDNDTPYLVMDYVEGEGLDVIITKHAPLGPTLVMQYLLQIAAALDYAHPRGVVHRDIKPSNILVDKSGNVFVLDFGVATINASFSESKSSVSGGPVMGTPGYMSPEQILNQALDHRSDLFSFAAVAFECFTGKRPFAGDTFTTVVGNILNSKPLALSSLVPELPLALEAEFEKALARNKEDRYPTAMAMIEAFASALGLDENLSKAAMESNHLPSAPRKRKSSGWRSFRPPKKEGPRPVRTRKTTAERLSPWKSDTGPISDPYAYAAPQNAMHRTPGSQWAHEDESLHGPRRVQLATSGAVRQLTFVVAGICIALGAFLLWILYERGGAENTLANISGEQSVEMTTPEGQHVSFKRDDLLSDAGLIKPQTEAVPQGKEAHEMTDKQILGILVDEKSSDTLLLAAIAEARERKIRGLVEASAVPLRNDSYIVRIETIKGLAEMGDSRVVPELVLTLDDHDPLVRGNVAKALGALGDRRALGYLNARYLKEDAPDVKELIRKAIEKINGFPMKQ